jgi:hypothetical protein
MTKRDDKESECRNVGILDQLLVISDTQLTRGSSLQDRQAKSREYAKLANKRQGID